MFSLILACNETKLDIVLILDSSATIGPNNFRAILNAAKEFIYKLDLVSGFSRIGILTFNSVVSVHFHLNSLSSTSELVETVNKIDYIAGERNTADAIKILRE